MVKSSMNRTPDGDANRLKCTRTNAEDQHLIMHFDLNRPREPVWPMIVLFRTSSGNRFRTSQCMNLRSNQV
ncbi:hypothetical protein X777_12720 [Ooceraea biroi]|uniref:Uncharacterized protein n=1 Tax=Ooceraea biroi TaxID=2015173 RepID=A0A026W163_OOCBI|nr:hypothetical protein X777_12720 [Ooceraea biroi]